MNRLEAGLLKLNHGEVDLGVVVREVMARLQVLTPSSPIAVTAPEHLPIVGDRDRLEQVLTNLVTNAIRYSPAHAAIELKVEASGDSAQLSVRDHGMAVPLDQQRRIFERFARVRPGGEGLGLGLAIAKAIVEQHGGNIWVESSGVPGEGSVFFVRLPRGGKK